jgi:hypothetical protein
MCFSAEASLGVAVALLPVGAYCVEAAWRKDRRYLPLAAIPVLFGLQQLCEARVWAGLGLGDPDLARVPSLAFLFFALVVWPVWVPLAVAAAEPRGRSRWALVALATVGATIGAAYYLPVAADGGRGLGPAVVGHSVRYDFSGVSAAAGWAWPALYLVAVCGPLLASRDRHLWPLGVGVAVAAVASYVLFEYAFASVWCFLAAVLSAYLAFPLYALPERPQRLAAPA